MDAWLNRIEPRVLSEWMAFERLEPWGWPVVRVLIDWGRSVVAMLCTASSGATIDRNNTPDVTVAADVARSQTGHSEEEADEGDESESSHSGGYHSAASDAEFSDAAGEPTSADILRAVAEQNQFRF